MLVLQFRNIKMLVSLLFYIIHSYLLLHLINLNLSVLSFCFSSAASSLLSFSSTLCTWNTRPIKKIWKHVRNTHTLRHFCLHSFWHSRSFKTNLHSSLQHYGFSASFPYALSYDPLSWTLVLLPSFVRNPVCVLTSHYSFLSLFTPNYIHSAHFLVDLSINRQLVLLPEHKTNIPHTLLSYYPSFLLRLCSIEEIIGNFSHPQLFDSIWNSPLD